MGLNCCIFDALRNFAEYSDEANYLVVCLGSSCTSAVERSPHNIKIVGLIPTECRSYSPCILKKVPRGGAALLFFLLKMNV